MLSEYASLLSQTPCPLRNTSHQVRQQLQHTMAVFRPSSSEFRSVLIRPTCCMTLLRKSPLARRVLPLNWSSILPQKHFQLLPNAAISPPAVGSCGRRNIVPSDENAELKGSPFKAWSRSVYCHTCYAYCQGFLPR